MTDDSIVEDKEAHRLGTISRWDPPEADWAADHDWTRYRGPQPYPVPEDWVLDTPEGGIVGWYHFPDVGEGQATVDDVYDEFEAEYHDWDAYQDAVEEARGVRAFLSNDIVEDDRHGNVILEHELSIAGDTIFRRVDPSETELWARTAEALSRYAEDDDVEEIAKDIGFQSGRLPDELQEEREKDRRREENAGLDEFAPDGGRVPFPSRLEVSEYAGGER
jgi:hypothetical protein